MSTQVQLRRGTTLQHSTFTGALGEVTVDTDKKTLVVHDGVTPGGNTLLSSVSVLAITAGGTGATTASGARANLGLGNVDNTSDLNKPISTATQTALDLKAPLVSPALTGVPTAPTASAGTNTTQIATTAFAIANSGAITVVAAQTATGTETALNFTSIPASAKRIVVNFVSVSTNGTSNPVVQLGTSSGYETTGYAGSATNTTAGNVSGSNHSVGFRPQNSVIATTVFSGAMTLTKVTGNTWTVSGNVGSSDVVSTGACAGHKTLAGTLDRLRLTTEGGTNTFDSGSIVNIVYES